MYNKLKKLLSREKEHTPVLAANNQPFFILGCVRSGTTMLRNILRFHPRLECPEETHFFRWSDPFRSPRFMHPYNNNKIIQKQQRMDGISEAEFAELIKMSGSKKELAENYGQFYLEKQGNPDGRWFDKTPQNIYGILLISQMMPDTRFIHIYRNPLNVVASLFEGKVLEISDMAGATSYWNESMSIMEEYKKIGKDRVLEIAYEKLTSKPEKSVGKILEFLGENPAKLELPKDFVHPEKDKYKNVLSSEDIAEIKRRCMPFLKRYGYS
jgi:hypothetical protein